MKIKQGTILIDGIGGYFLVEGDIDAELIEELPITRKINFKRKNYFYNHEQIAIGRIILNPSPTIRQLYV
jgi:hypothetical protein